MRTALIVPPAVGLSPRVRGNRLRLDAGAAARGSIPACAGEPPSMPLDSPSRTVYPRVCGGTSFDKLGLSIDEGLSPRVRGNL